MDQLKGHCLRHAHYLVPVQRRQLGKAVSVLRALLPVAGQGGQGGTLTTMGEGARPFAGAAGTKCRRQWIRRSLSPIPEGLESTGSAGLAFSE